MRLPGHIKENPDMVGEKQELFGFLLAKLLLNIYHAGYSVRVGETYRTDAAWLATPRGRQGRRSAHQDKLAVDLNLMKDGVYLDKTEDHQVFGEWWELQHPLCRWGGRFGDGNHYSLEHGGIK